MNILTDQLPDTVEGYQIYTDYKRWILYETVLKDDSLDWQDKLTECLMLTVKEPESILPEDMERVLKGLITFHAGPGYDPEASTPSHQGRGPEAYDYDIDQALILAAFRQAYGIDLSTASMHWWVFSALLQGLPDDTRFMTIVGYRTADTSKMPKETARQYSELKARYAIRRDKPPMTKAEAEARLRQKVADVFARAQREKEKREKQHV